MKLILEQVSILQGLDHPNIVRYLETYNDKTYLFLVTEYVEGRKIFEQLTKGKGLPEETVRVYIRDITTAIHHCHVKGIIHRAISPESIAVTKMGHIKIVDFGFCTFAKNVEKAKGVLRQECLAPEIGLTKIVTESVDVWSIGCLMHLFLSGIPIDVIEL